MDTKASSDLTLAVAVVLFGGVGTYLLLPHRHGAAKPRSVHAVGAVLAGIGLLLFALFWKPPGPLLTGLFFYGFSLSALAGAVLTISARNPIYSALWFASVVLSTSGLFLIAGAQFLAVGTVIVYAGAIIVTFLFVIMLAQMEGRALYDRAARSPMRATLTCFLLFWAVLYSLFLVPPPSRGPKELNEPDRRLVPSSAIALANPRVRVVMERAIRTTAKFTDEQGKVKPHVASLGGTLYTDHLIVVELAGALLFVALIGALAIATPKPPIRPGDRRGAPNLTP